VGGFSRLPILLLMLVTEIALLLIIVLSLLPFGGEGVLQFRVCFSLWERAGVREKYRVNIQG
jgi:hypothetical protein